MLQQEIFLPKVVNPPKETVLVNVTPQESRVAFLENDLLHEFQIERNFSTNTVGNIYLGRVIRVLPGMQSAFIDIGLERAAFLHFVDLMENKISIETVSRIETVLFEGQPVLVQVIKEPIANKGARVTTQISIVGRYLVFLPQDDHIGISQKIENEDQRNLLKQKLIDVLPPDSKGGYIIRTRAEFASQAELEKDVQFLAKFWTEIKSLLKIKAPPSLIYKELDISLRVLRDLVGENTEQILVDSMKAFKEMQHYASLYCTELVKKIYLFNSEAEDDLFATYGINEIVKKALLPRVNIKFGGYLFIESTESMTTIDVNTGGFVGANNFQETIFKTNLEACAVIAREIRLRNIGGIIIIDFIDMESEIHQQSILEELAKLLSFDKTKVTLNGFTSLGLVELTRKRTRSSLKNMLTEKCSYCTGNGFIKSIDTICYEIMQLIYKEVGKYGYSSLKLIASTEVIDRLLDEISKPLLNLCQEINAEVSLVVDVSFARDYFELYADK